MNIDDPKNLLEPLLYVHGKILFNYIKEGTVVEVYVKKLLEFSKLSTIKELSKDRFLESRGLNIDKFELLIVDAISSA